MDVFIGSLMLVPYNYEPHGYAFCDGRLLPISQNAALFALLGTQFGGDGKTTFALPDLRGRVPIGAGQGPGLRNYVQAQTGGTEKVALNQSQMPSHAHSICATAATASLSNTNGALLGRPASGNVYCSGGTANTQLAPDTVVPAGAGMPHENRSPYVAMNWIIALQGIFPQRP
ncbi:MAG TPA: tail fiber protein [Bryobacteraceae bacterium]|nr:tail fiber protein [Bryobacteraceae bacterium]